MRRRTLVSLFPHFIVAVLVSACGGGGGAAVQAPAPVPAPTLQSVAVTPANLSLQTGASRQFIVTGTYSNGTTQDLTSSAVWSSSAVSTASITQGGLVTAVKPGTSTITANSSGIFNTATLSITPPIRLNALAWSGSKFVSVGSTMGTSTDGTAWVGAVSPLGDSDSKLSEASLNGVSWDGNQFLAVGRDGGQPPCLPGNVCSFVVTGVHSVIFKSPDGLAWTLATASGLASEVGIGLNSIVSSLGRSVAVGHGGTIVRSVDGYTWTRQASGTDNMLTAVAGSGTKFVAVGVDGMILASADGAVWTRQISGTQEVLAAVTWAGSQFVAVGVNGTVIASPDGVTWTRQQSNTTQTLYGIAWSGKLLVAVGASGTVITSVDGMVWTARGSVTNNGLKSIIWAGNQFVAGADGTILTSPDGVTWTTRN
jgi:hypothetical protein